MLGDVHNIRFNQTLLFYLHFVSKVCLYSLVASSIDFLAKVLDFMANFYSFSFLILLFMDKSSLF